MLMRRLFLGLAFVAGLTAAFVALTCAPAADRPSKLASQAAQAERILIGVPEKKGVEPGGTIDVAPGGQFYVEIQRALRGTGRKAALALIINGGDEKKHPKFIAGRQYVFLLKKDPDSKRWVNLGSSEIPIKEGKVQYLDDGKVLEEVALKEFEDLAAKDDSAVVVKAPTRETLTGKWIVALSISKGADAYLWLVEFGKADGKENESKSGEAPGPTAKLLSSSKLMEAATLKSSSVVGRDVHLVFDAGGGTFDFRGRFENGTVRGNIVPERSTVMPARMEPTDVKNMRRYDEPVADPAREDFIDAAGQEESFGPLSRFVRRHPQSPLALNAFLDLVAHAQAEGFDRAKFEKLAGEYLQSAASWGPRMELKAYVDMGLVLSRHDYLPDLALEYLNTADQRFDDESPLQWKQSVSIERGKRLIAAGQAAEGVALLTRLRDEYPFEPEVTYALALQAEKENKTDEALGLYGELAILPLEQQELIESLQRLGRKPPREQYPSRIVTRLWTEKNGDRKGLSDWLDQLYESKIRSIAADKRPPRQKNEGTRIAVCELFTNGDCRPCVGADVATTALEATYEQSEVIVLRYHQHRPGPDPLANEDSVDRAKQYQTEGTPTLILNGKRFPGGGGSLSDAPAVYKRLRSLIDPILEEKIDLRLQLSAKASQGKIAISATALGLKKFPANARLMLILAEDKIDCPLNNGIRTHEMIVRSMPSGLEGIAPAKGQGQLSYTGEIDLARLRKRLAKQLTTVERENDVEFDEKPLDLKALHFVVLLQNVDSGDVLQAASVPVTGSTGTADDAKSTGKTGGAGQSDTGGE